jgi:hypothetical protein
MLCSGWPVAHVGGKPQVTLANVMLCLANCGQEDALDVHPGTPPSCLSANPSHLKVSRLEV